MFLVPRRQVWTQQPQGHVEIDWQTSRDFGISEVYLGSSPGRLLVGGAVPTRSASIVDIVSDKGKAASFNYVNDESIQIGNTADEVLGGAATTIAVLRRCRDTTNRASELFAYDGGGVNRCLSHAPYSDGNIYWDFADSIAGSGRLSAAYTKDTAWETLVFVAGQSKGREIWRRGIRIANNAAAKAIRSSSTLPFLLGASGLSSDNVDVALFVVSPNEWTDAQIRQWSESPWQIFKRSDSRIFVPVSVGGGSTQTLTPPLHTNSQSFYSPAVSQSSAPQSLTASLFTSSSTIFVPTVQASKALSVGLFSNANTPYSPTVTATKTLATSFYSNAQVFYPPAVSVGAVSISPPLYSNTPTFYAHVLNQVGGPQNVVVPLFNNTQTFYSPLLSPGAVSVTPSLYANAPTFYGLTVTTSKTLTASLFSNASELYEPLVTLAGGPQIIAPSLFSNTASFFTHMVASGLVQLYPVRFDSPSVFYAPVVSTGSFSGSISDADITRIVQAVLLQLNNESIAAAVWAHATRVITGPTPNENADALLARNWP